METQLCIVIKFSPPSAAHHKAVTGGEEGTRRDQQRCRRYNLRDDNREGDNKSSSREGEQSEGENER